MFSLFFRNIRLNFFLGLVASSNVFSQSNFPIENEQSVITIPENDFHALVQQRQQGLIGYHHNIDSSLLIPAPENALLNWTSVLLSEKKRLINKQEEMFRKGKITMIVMAGGEATRFGQPKPFVKVSNELGEFLEIKAANLNWLQSTYGTQVPLYILTSEKRLPEFKKAISERNYYGLNPKIFRWFVQGTVDTFIPSDEELKLLYNGSELNDHLSYARAIRQENPDGIYRFNKQSRKVPPGHFDTLAAFIVSGHLSEALASGIEFILVVNIDNLQAILKNDGMIAYFAETGDDFGFFLTEKNVYMTITDKSKNCIIQDKMVVRFRDNILSFDGIQEFTKEAEKDGYRYVINQNQKNIDVFNAANGQKINIEIKIKPEVGGTLVQKINDKGEMIGIPMMREGFELPSNFDHLNAPFFNTNTIIINLKSLLKFLKISQDQLAKMDFKQRNNLVIERLVKSTKPNFEIKNHQVEGEFPKLGVVSNFKTKILVVQLTRIMLQTAHLPNAKVSYIYAPRASIFAPVKEPEDIKNVADTHSSSLKTFLKSQRGTFEEIKF